jgi:triacylglycerol esterase/lipase EstA (alpha/beta hydrolase family)
LLTILAGLVVLLGTSGLVATAASADTDPTGPAQNNFAAAFLYSEQNPTAVPPGANDWTCRPGAAHPRPVVLVHGTFENRYDNWAELSPQLKAAGYCVYALNYGGSDGSVFQGTNEIAASAGQLATFVDQVLAATGASKVDLVGHSQGGMMPRYYLKNLGGAAKVANLVALVPSNHGTTLDGIADLAVEFPVLGVLVGIPCQACTEQIQGSTFVTALNSGGETSSSVKYTVISTTHDEVVTPYTSAFLAAGSNVTNETVQDFCPSDSTEHVGIAYDTPALQLVRNALDPAHATAPTC